VAADLSPGDVLTGKLLKKFPVGSSAIALEAELKREGDWSPVGIDNSNGTGPQKFVVFNRRVGLLAIETTIILWKSDEDDRLIDVRASKLRDSSVP
jgi:hypothetical protein